MLKKIFHLLDWFFALVFIAALFIAAWDLWHVEQYTSSFIVVCATLVLIIQNRTINYQNRTVKALKEGYDILTELLHYVHQIAEHKDTPTKPTKSK